MISSCACRLGIAQSPSLDIPWLFPSPRSFVTVRVCDLERPHATSSEVTLHACTMREPCAHCARTIGAPPCTAAPLYRHYITHAVIQDSKQHAMRVGTTPLPQCLHNCERIERREFSLTPFPRRDAPRRKGCQDHEMVRCRIAPRWHPWFVRAWRVKARPIEIDRDGS